jgi:hypothetical protein
LIESIYFDESALVFYRNTFTSSPHVLQVNFDGFSNIPERFFSRITLRNAAGENGRLRTRRLLLFAELRCSAWNGLFSRK